MNLSHACLTSSRQQQEEREEQRGGGELRGRPPVQHSDKSRRMAPGQCADSKTRKQQRGQREGRYTGKSWRRKEGEERGKRDRERRWNQGRERGRKNRESSCQSWLSKTFDSALQMSQWMSTDCVYMCDSVCVWVYAFVYVPVCMCPCLLACEVLHGAANWRILNVTCILLASHLGVFAIVDSWQSTWKRQEAKRKQQQQQVSLLSACKIWTAQTSCKAKHYVYAA